MAIFLRGYGNKNYRSLGNEGVHLSELKDINVIIGQNNGGKTNILRSLQIWESSRRGNPIVPQATDHFQNDSNNQIEFQFEAEDVNEVFTGLLKTTDKMPFVRYKLVSENQYEIIDSFVRYVDQDALREFCNGMYSTSSSDQMQNIKSVESRPEFSGLFSLPEIIFIEEARVQATPRLIRDKLEPIWSHGAANSSMRPIKKALREFIEQGMESQIEIQFEPGGESFSIATSDDELVTFESLGSGFRQIFNLALTIASTSNSIVLIDEPELNMHPSLLRRLMKLIFSNNTNQYIISTHSNVLLDAQHEKSVYRISGGQYSTVMKCDNVDDSRDLLNDLGVRASEILQSNGIIWVEGPSDRTYIKKWLELNSSESEEGLDYSFQYYGGKLLAHYSIDSDIDDFINILDINRNAYIVMDSDWKDNSREWKLEDLAERKRKIIDVCEQKNIPYWVTAGTEIENYISNEIWSQYSGSAVEIQKYDNVASSVPKYKIKAKESHKVAELINDDDYKNNVELSEKIKELDKIITNWNQQ